MTAFWHTLDDTQQSAITIGLTLLAGLLIATAVCFTRHGIPRRYGRNVLDDLDCQEYREVADEADLAPLTDWERALLRRIAELDARNEAVVAAFRADLDQWGQR